jgi:putative DNA methylase
MVPLVSSFMLSTKDGKKAWVEPVIDPDAADGWRFKVCTGMLSKAQEERLKEGTKAARGNFVCLLTGAAIGEDYNRSQGAAGQLGERLIAIIAEGSSRRLFLTLKKR